MQRSHQLCGQSAFSTLGVQLNQFFPLVSKEKEGTTGVSFLIKQRAQVSHGKRHKAINKNNIHKDRLNTSHRATAGKLSCFIHILVPKSRHYLSIPRKRKRAQLKQNLHPVLQEK